MMSNKGAKSFSLVCHLFFIPHPDLFVWQARSEHQLVAEQAWVEGENVWLGHRDGFTAGRQLQQENGVTTLGEGRVRVRLDHSEEVLEVDEDDVEKANPPLFDRVEDLALLRYLNESSVLHTIRQRYGNRHRTRTSKTRLTRLMLKLFHRALHNFLSVTFDVAERPPVCPTPGRVPACWPSTPAASWTSTQRRSRECSGSAGWRSCLLTSTALARRRSSRCSTPRRTRALPSSGAPAAGKAPR